MNAVAALARTLPTAIRVAHEQNLVLPDVRKADLYRFWQRATGAGLATANIGLLSDMIVCPGGDYCALANAQSIPIAQSIQRFADLDELHEVGPIRPEYFRLHKCLWPSPHWQYRHSGRG